jgi:tetratricopeptide (TPR) repeat protein
LLETIRQYALEKLMGTEEARSIRDGHLGFYLDLAEKSEPYIFSSESAIWVSRLGKELDNIRAAMDWSTNSGKAVIALQIAGSLVNFWWAYAQLPSEWYDRVQQALSRPEGRERTLARAKALNGIGFIFWLDVDLTDRRPELVEALSIGRELDDRWNIATALRNLGLLELIRENYPEARSFLEQSLEIWSDMRTEGKLGYAMTLAFLGDVELSCNDTQKSRSLYNESAAVLRGPHVGDINFLGYPIRRLGQLAWREGHYEEAKARCKESLRLNHEVGDPRGVMSCVAGFAAIAVAQEKFERAAQLMAAVETQLTLISIQPPFMDKMEYERNLALVRAKLGEKVLAKIWAKGKAMSFEDAVALALEAA